MACNITLADVSFTCEDLGIGGLKSVYLGNKSDLSTEKESVTTQTDYTPVTVSNGTVTVTPDPDTAKGLHTDTDVTFVQFNLKDGFSVFSEVKTVSADGVVSSVPTISIEIPKMSKEHRNALDNLAKPGAELVAFVETAAGTYHMVGWEYGLYASTVDGNSGTGRSEKNRYQITLTGEEDSLSYNIESTEWSKVIA
jgi:hypothetical protein